MKVLTLLIASLAFLLLTTSGPLAIAADPGTPAPGISGRYAKPGNAAMYFDLRPDGTLTVAQGMLVFSGTYTVKGVDVTLIIPSIAPNVVQIANGVMTMQDGSKWPRVGNAGPAPAPPH